jgi:apolipoprotein N-acyltransferase
MTAAFPPWEQAAAGWIAWVPLLLALRAGWANPGMAWVAGTLAWLTQIHWLRHVTPLGTVLLCMYLGAYWALAAALWSDWMRRWPATTTRANLGLSFAFATAWTGLEQIRGTLFSGFPWHPLGVSQWDNLPIAHLAAVGGVPLVTWLLAWCHAMGALTLVRLRREARSAQRLRPHLDFSVTIVLIGLSFVAGVARMWEKPPPSDTWRVGMVQGNIPQSEKFYALPEEELVGRYDRLTRLVAAQRPDLILWPESATGSAVFQDPTLTATLRDLTRDSEFSLLIGALDFDGMRFYNAAFAFLPQENGYSIYRKEHLVPFGEFIPGRRWFSWITDRFSLQMEDYTPGEGPGTVNLQSRSGDQIRAGVLICFEDVLADLARSRTSEEARLLVNVTNDGWFRDSAAAWQHTVHALFRSIETGLPLVRCANTGVSCIIDRAGRVTDVLQDEHGKRVEIEGFLVGRVEVPKVPPSTLYLRGGWLFGPACALAVVIVLLVRMFGRRQVYREAFRRSIHCLALARRGSGRETSSGHPRE